MKKFDKIYYPFYLVLPALLIYSVFYIVPNVSGFILAMTDWNMLRISDIRFIGFDNFETLFEQSVFFTALKNVIFFTIFTTIIKNFAGLGLALLLNRNLRGINIFRGVFYLPSVLSVLVVGYIFVFFLNPTIGFLNNTLRDIGLEALVHSWLGDPKTAMFAIASVDNWMFIGFMAVIYLAGLQTIPEELLNAGRIDGASAWNLFWRIKLPILRPIINFSIVLCIIGGIKVFDIVFAMTGGGPGSSTTVLNMLMFKELSFGNLGYASAIGFISFFIAALISIPTLRALKKREIEF